jgi:hypothetical protein
MRANAAKCGVVRVGGAEGAPQPVLRVHNEPIPWPAGYKYLGIMITPTLNFREADKHRSGAAWAVLRGPIGALIDNERLPGWVGVRLLKSVLLASALYGSEIWGCSIGNMKGARKLCDFVLLKLLTGTKQGVSRYALRAEFGVEDVEVQAWRRRLHLLERVSQKTALRSWLKLLVDRKGAGWLSQVRADITRVLPGLGDAITRAMLAKTEPVVKEFRTKLAMRNLAKGWETWQVMAREHVSWRWAADFLLHRSRHRAGLRAVHAIRINAFWTTHRFQRAGVLKYEPKPTGVAGSKLLACPLCQKEAPAAPTIRGDELLHIIFRCPHLDALKRALINDVDGAVDIGPMGSTKLMWRLVGAKWKKREMDKMHKVLQAMISFMQAAGEMRAKAVEALETAAAEAAAAAAAEEEEDEEEEEEEDEEDEEVEEH